MIVLISDKQIKPTEVKAAIVFDGSRELDNKNLEYILAATTDDSQGMDKVDLWIKQATLGEVSIMNNPDTDGNEISMSVQVNYFELKNLQGTMRLWLRFRDNDYEYCCDISIKSAAISQGMETFPIFRKAGSTKEDLPHCKQALPNNDMRVCCRRLKP